MLTLFLSVIFFIAVFSFHILYKKWKFEISRFDYWLGVQAELMFLISQLDETDEWQDSGDSPLTNIRLQLILESYQRAREAVSHFERKFSVRVYLFYVKLKN